MMYEEEDDDDDQDDDDNDDDDDDDTMMTVQTCRALSTYVHVVLEAVMQSQRQSEKGEKHIGD